MNEIDKAWLSGFIDGEGHVGIHSVNTGGKGKLYYSGNCFIRNTHYDSMLHIKFLLEDLLGREVKVSSEQRERGKDSYYTNVSSFSDLSILGGAVYPYSVTKQKQWELLIEYVESRMKLTGLVRPYSEREMQIVLQMSTINKRWAEGVK